MACWLGAYMGARANNDDAQRMRPIADSCMMMACTLCVTVNCQHARITQQWSIIQGHDETKPSIVCWLHQRADMRNIQDVGLKRSSLNDTADCM